MTATLLERFGRRVRLGMVGGGADSIIGETHRIAMRVDGLCELTAGALSVDAEVALASGRANLLSSDRIYTDYQKMAVSEAGRPDRIDAVVIATPPQLHLEVAREFLRHGFDVICEKPMTCTAAESDELVTLVESSGRLFLLTHCYTAYPMVRQAKAMVGDGAIGPVRLIETEFCGGDEGVVREPADPARRHWRFRLDAMGPAAILGEVGSHAYNIVCYVTGSRATRVSAHMSTVAARREVYDNAYLYVEYDSGAEGRIWSSYVAAGNEHGLSFRIFGDEGALLWRQEEPEVLWHQSIGKPAVRLTRGLDGLASASRNATRFRPGHPEGYALAFANLYRDFALGLIAREVGETAQAYLSELPTVADGADGMRLIEAAELSQQRNGELTLLRDRPKPAAARDEDRRGAAP